MRVDHMQSVWIYSSTMEDVVQPEAPLVLIRRKQLHVGRDFIDGEVSIWSSSKWYLSKFSFFCLSFRLSWRSVHVFICWGGGRGAASQKATWVRTVVSKIQENRLKEQNKRKTVIHNCEIAKLFSWGNDSQKAKGLFLHTSECNVKQKNLKKSNPINVVRVENWPIIVDWWNHVCVWL